MASVESMLRESVIDKNGAKVSWSSLTGERKVIGLYFSAHWCPPCRNFTPKLADWYNKMKSSDKGKDFDIIFVSSDHDQAAFDEYYGTMPWLGMQFSERSSKEQLSKKFKVSGIPTFILLDGVSGDVITSKARDKIGSDPDGFPWRPQSFSEIFYSGNFIKQDGSEVASADLKGKVKGIYFSAHWCPPCRGFTPKLAETYKKLQAQGKNFEIVFASSDRDEAGFKDYFGSMPWISLPFGDARKAKLSDMCGVEGIPSLAIFDENDVKITLDGRAAVGGDPEGVDFPWLPKPLNELKEATASAINEKASLVYFTDGKTEGVQAAKDHLKVASEKHFNKNQDDQRLLFFYTVNDDIIDSLRSFAKIPEKEPYLAIVDISNQEVYECSSTTIDAEAVNTFVDDFTAGKLQGRALRG